MFSNKHILNVYGHLSEAQHILTETPTPNLSGLTLCSVDKFKQPFGILLNKELTNKMTQPVDIDITSEETLEGIKFNIIQAVTSYN